MAVSFPRKTTINLNAPWPIDSIVPDVNEQAQFLWKLLAACARSGICCPDCGRVFNAPQLPLTSHEMKEIEPHLKGAKPMYNFTFCPRCNPAEERMNARFAPRSMSHLSNNMRAPSSPAASSTSCATPPQMTSNIGHPGKPLPRGLSFYPFQAEAASSASTSQLQYRGNVQGSPTTMGQARHGSQAMKSAAPLVASSSSGRRHHGATVSDTSYPQGHARLQMGNGSSVPQRREAFNSPSADHTCSTLPASQTGMLPLPYKRSLYPVEGRHLDCSSNLNVQASSSQQRPAALIRANTQPPGQWSGHVPNPPHMVRGHGYAPQMPSMLNHDRSIALSRPPLVHANTWTGPNQRNLPTTSISHTQNLNSSTNASSSSQTSTNAGFTDQYASAVIENSQPTNERKGRKRARDESNAQEKGRKRSRKETKSTPPTSANSSEAQSPSAKKVKTTQNGPVAPDDAP